MNKKEYSNWFRSCTSKLQLKVDCKKNWAGPRASPNANSLVHDLHLKIESIIFLKICELFFWSKRQHTLLIMLTFCVPVANNSTYNFIAPRI